MRPVIEDMMELNRAAGEAMLEAGVHAATDVTGFGLAGHMHEMLEASGVGARLDWKALPLFDAERPILIHNVDILSNLDLTALPTDAPLLVVSQRQTKRYLQFDDTMRLVGWKNIETGEVKGREGNSLAFSGIHMFHPSLTPLLSDWPERFPIMDFYLKACGSHLIRGYEAKDLRLMDVGKLDTLDQAEAFIDGI
jgi:NDP-sugar pyrophosphorylase family protein